VNLPIVPSLIVKAAALSALAAFGWNGHFPMLPNWSQGRKRPVLKRTIRLRCGVLSRDDLLLLQAVLRSRSRDAAQLAHSLGRTVDDVVPALDRLADAGFLSRGHRGSVLRPPQEALIGVAVDELTAQSEAAAALGRTLAELPALIRDWEWGRPEDESSIPAEVIEGPTAIVDAWWRYVDRSRPLSTVGVIPDAHGFTLVPEEDAARLTEFVDPHGGGIRLIINPDSLDEASRPTVDALRSIGLRFRTLADAPGWFFVDGDRVAALPAQWGDPWPQRVLLARNAVIADALRGYFELLWREATEIEAAPPPWEPILRLLDEGMTEEEIARELHVSARTVRRRVVDAMEAFGVTNRFTLGRAWSRRGGS
jgi:hypothetical protein